MSISRELSSIDFAGMIGGPLVAVVNAQAKSAMTTVSFVKEVGFYPRDYGDSEGSDEEKAQAALRGKPVYVEFDFTKQIEQQKKDNEGNLVTDNNGDPEMELKPVEMQLKVPILTMLPIPYLRVEEVEINFNAKITSMTKTSSETEKKIGGSFEAQAKWGWGSAKLKVSASYKSKKNSSSELAKTYSLGVRVRAVQDEMPAGMEKVLNILEENISATPKSS